MSETTSAWIQNIGEADFQARVVEQSQQRPVIVDLWAPWCGPCRQLAPILEKIVVELDGQVFLAKINTDEQPGLAQSFGVQSIPFVVAVVEGRIVDQFAGVLPEPELRAWIARLMPSPAETRLQAGLELEDSDPVAAEQHYREAAELDPKLFAAKIRLAGLLFRQERLDESGAVIRELEQRGFLEPEAEQIKSELELRAAADEAGGLDEARKAAAAAPDNLKRQLQLAEALAAGRKFEEALQICIRVVQQDRQQFGEAAREVMVMIFNTLGNANPLVGEYRRKLATALY